MLACVILHAEKFILVWLIPAAPSKTLEHLTGIILILDIHIPLSKQEIIREARRFQPYSEINIR